MDRRLRQAYKRWQAAAKRYYRAIKKAPLECHGAQARHVSKCYREYIQLGGV